jgi:plastocyanin
VVKIMHNDKKKRKSMNDELDNQSTEGPSPAASNNAKRKNRVLLGLILLALAIAVVVGIASKSNDKTINTTQETTANVSISASSFFPNVIDVKPGQPVTWTNTDSNPHWIASDPYPKDDALKSLNSNGTIGQNETYSYTFEKAGTYTYHDELHPTDLMGTVRVK